MKKFLHAMWLVLAIPLSGLLVAEILAGVIPLVAVVFGGSTQPGKHYRKFL